MAEQRTPEDWGAFYEAERPLYEAFTVGLEGLLRQLLERASIPYVQIEGRTKGVPNFVAKLRRKNEKYKDPLAEVTDLAGLRIVLFYLDDVSRVGDLIEKQFAVDQSHSEDKSAALDPTRFGYLSVHHVIQLSDSREALPEWERFAGLYAEVQVRTVLQHAWGAISRKLAYASVHEAPRKLQRNLNRLSALLELADDEFVDIRLARETIEAEYDREVERGNLDLEIDESSLESYLRETGARDRIKDLAEKAGAPKEYDVPEQEDDYDDLRQEISSRLLEVMEISGLGRIADLDKLLSGAWSWVPRFMQDVNDRYSDSDGKPTLARNPDNWLTLLVLWATRASKDTIMGLGYVDRLAEAITSTYPED
jgi:putative GTP pyrophosphokinase